MRPLWSTLWLGCAGPVATDTVDDVVPAEDVPADTDRPAEVDTPGPTETDPDPADTDRVEPPAPFVPPDLGAGFVDVSAALFAAWPREVYAGDRARRDAASLTGVHVTDLTGDGAPEVLVLGTAPVGGAPRTWVLRWDAGAGALVPDDALTARFDHTDPELIAVVDLDGDGLADLVPGRRAPGPDLARPDGGYTSTPNLSYAGQYAGGLVDLDEDGLTDVLLEGGACGSPWSVALSDGLGRWRVRDDLSAWSVAGLPYVVGLARFGGEPVVMTLGGPCDDTAYQPGFSRYVGQGEDDVPRFVEEDLLPDDALYKLTPASAGLPISRQRPMGAAVSDLDGDGDVDLAITTTYPRLLVFRADGPPPFVDVSWDAGAILPPRWPDADGRPGAVDIEKPWGIAALDVDRDGAHDLVVVDGGDFSDWYTDAVGEFAPLLYLQRDGVFHEATAGSGLDVPHDGRGLAVADIDRDARPDLLLGGHGIRPKILLNRIDTGRPPVAVRLTGTTSPVVAHGAQVRFEDDGVIGPAVMIGGVVSLGPLSEPIAFGTSGPDGVLDAVHIAWPSGYTQIVRDLPARAVHEIVEPPTITVTPATRRLPADGAARAVVRVTPRDADGAPRAAVVDVRLRAGAGVILGPPTPVGEGWEVEVQAPTAPGFATFEVWIDGVAMQVRPRVVWE